MGTAVIGKYRFPQIYNWYFYTPVSPDRKHVFMTAKGQMLDENSPQLLAA